MSEQTGIEWCDSTFNPWIGCTKVSPGCDHCYAENLMATRWQRVQWGPGATRQRTSAANWRLPVRWNAEPFLQCKCGWRGEERAAPIVDEPGESMRHCPACNGRGTLQRARRRVFCASLADVFDNEVDSRWRADLFALIQATPNLDWLVLTKRIGSVPGMVREAARSLGWVNVDTMQVPLPANVWLGATVVNQEESDRDIPKLLATPAAVRWLSCEPLLGPMDIRGKLARLYRDADGPRKGIDWIVAGGESGPGARQCDIEWIRSLDRAVQSGRRAGAGEAARREPGAAGR